MLSTYHPKLTQRIIKQTPTTIVGLTLTSIVFIWVYKDFIPFNILLFWALGQVFFIFLRFLNAKKLACSIKKSDNKRTQLHTTILLVLIIYSAILWTASSFLVLIYAPAYYEILSFCMITGIVIAGVLTLAPFFFIYAVYFFILTLSQMGILLFLGEHIHISAAILLAIFIPMVFLFSKSIYKDSLLTIKLQTSLEENVKELHTLSITDALTNTYNRRYFYLLGEKMLALSKRKNNDISLLMIDVDHFKRVNDNYGHQAGDAILIGLTKKIKNKIRECDVFARVGGEEFALLLQNTSLGAAKKIADKLCLSIQKMEFNHKGIEINISISIGIATLSDKDSSLDALYQQADLHLYQAKEQGRNQYCF